MWETLANDSKIAFRTLSKRPGFVAIAILNLALGIGANTAMFSIVYAVLLKPLPYSDPDRLVLVHKANPRRVSPNGTHWVSTGDFQDWQEHNAVFESMAGYADGRQLDFYRAGDETPETVGGATVSPNLFDTLGVPLLLGRTFLPEEQELGGPRAIILGYSLWRRRYGGDPDIVGKSISAGFVGAPPQRYTVVGIGRPGFSFPPGAEYWTAHFNPSGAAQQFRYQNYSIQPIARLRPGIGLVQAGESMRALGARLDAARSADEAFPVLTVGFVDHTVGTVKRALIVFTGAIGFVLMIACANLSNLILSRSMTKTRDVAIRTALGATRARMVRYLLTENLLLGLIGLGAGLLVAYGGMRAFLMLSPGGIPRADEITLGWPVLVFAAALSILSALLSGLWPAWSASRVPVSAALTEGFRKNPSLHGSNGRGLRSMLALGESALAMVLVVAAGLMLNSFLRLSFVDPGFNAENLLVVDIAGRTVGMASTGGDVGERPQQKHLDLLARILSVGGIQSAAFASTAPPEGAPAPRSFEVVGGTDGAQTVPEALIVGVSHGYFRAMQIPIIAGRGVEESDLGKPVVVVNQILARSYFDGTDPLGGQLVIAGESRTIVGIVGDVRQAGLGRVPQPTIYWPTVAGYRAVDQTLIPGGNRLIVRSGGDPSLVAESVRRLVESERLRPTRPSASILSKNLWLSLAQPRFRAFLITVFGLVGLILAALGIYGTVSVGAAQRAREIGIRMALGATPSAILRLIIGQAMLPVIVGIALGGLSAWGLTRSLDSLLYGLAATDPLTFAAAGTLLALVATLACWMPARRAARTDPAATVRGE